MSKLPFELLLALRYLRPKRTFVSIITLISVLGVALGVAVLIIVISVMSGFDHDLREKILGFNAHIPDKSYGERAEPMENYAAVMTLVASNKNVRGVAPFVLGQVLVETEPANTNASPIAHRRAVSARRGSVTRGKFREHSAAKHRCGQRLI